ncbi:MAG: glycosyltransferase [Planctomycetes bacterium]|nr:glycosyltransferase [Planctomycetota bacterium]
MKILHLIDPGAAEGGSCTLRVLWEVLCRLGGAHDVLLIGTARHRELAARCGLKVVGSLGASVRHGALGRTALGRFLRASETAAVGYDLVHAWSLRGAALAGLAMRGRRVVASVLGPPVMGRAAGLPPRALGRISARVGRVLVAAPALRDTCEAAGIDGALLSVVRPGVDHTAIDPSDRAALRRRWDVDENSLVVGLLGEPANNCDARTAVTAISRVALSGKDVRLLVHPDAIARTGVRAWLGKLAISGVLLVDDEVAQPWRVASGLDAALIITRYPSSVLPVVWAMAAGVPVMVEATAAMRQIVPSALSGLLFAPGDVNAVSEYILRLFDDVAAGRIRPAFGDRVAKSFSADAYAEHLGDVYHQLAGGEKNTGTCPGAKRRGAPLRVG